MEMYPVNPAVGSVRNNGPDSSNPLIPLAAKTPWSDPAGSSPIAAAVARLRYDVDIQEVAEHSIPVSALRQISASSEVEVPVGGGAVVVGNWRGDRVQGMP